ncbi:MAG: glycosyltransferase [Chloroflexi bacterium]|nr:glycosyltransferase [Chloroflexota bacterium]
MRILFALPYVPSRIRVRPYQFITTLARRHEVWVLAAGTSEDPPSSATLQDLCPSWEALPNRIGERIYQVARAALNGQPLQAAVCRSTAFERRFRELLERPGFDVVHVEHLRAAFLGPLIPPTVASLFDAVDSISLLWERTVRASHSRRQRLLARLELTRTRAYEARLPTWFDQLVATADEDARALEQLAPGTHVEVIPNGVDLAAFAPWEGPREPATLVFTGKMSYHANVTAVLVFVREILPLIRRSRPDARLVIAGRDPPRTVRALEADPGITVTGYVPDLRATVGRATVAVCPVTVKVGIQNKVLEAMAMGLPVVTTPAGLAGLTAQPGRDLLVGRDPAEFASQVCRLLEDPSLRERVGRSGRAYVAAHHRWKDAAARLEKLYERAIANRPGVAVTAPGSAGPGTRSARAAGPGYEPS